MVSSCEYAKIDLYFVLVTGILRLIVIIKLIKLRFVRASEQVPAARLKRENILTTSEIRERERERETERQRETERDRERQRETETETETERHRERQTD